MESKKIELLKNIPFKSFNEINQAIGSGEIFIGVARDVALQWTRNGIYLPAKTKNQVSLLIMTPFLTTIGFIIYIIYTGSWLLLFSLPLLVIGFFIFHPSSTFILGPIKKLAIMILIGSLLLGWFEDIDWLFAIALTQIINWIFLSRIYGIASSSMIEQAGKHEDLFCLLWEKGILSLHKQDGTSFYNTFIRNPDGTFRHYENQ